jgi:hypothetical protein
LSLKIFISFQNVTKYDEANGFGIQPAGRFITAAFLKDLTGDSAMKLFGGHDLWGVIIATALLSGCSPHGSFFSNQISKSDRAPLLNGSAAGISVQSSKDTPQSSPTVFPANSSSSFHRTGSATSATSWGVGSDSPSDFLTYGPYTTLFKHGTYKASFKLRLDNVKADNLPIGSIEVYDSSSQQSLAKKDFHRQNFAAPMVFQDFDLTFSVADSSVLEFRVFYYGYSYLEHAQTSVVQISDVAPTVFLANGPTSFHRTGSATSATSWGAWVESPPDFLTFGPYTTLFKNGSYKASFKLRLDNVDADNSTVGFIDVYDSSASRILARKEFRRRDFASPMTYQDFDLTFFVTDSSVLEFRVFYYGHSYLEHAQTSVLQLSSSTPTTFLANSETSFHVVGSATSDTSWGAWTTSPSGFMTYGPYTSLFRSGSFKASFRLRLDNVDADDLYLGFIEVYDSAAQESLGRRAFHRREFSTPMAYQDLDLTFTAGDASVLEFRVFYSGGSYVEHAQTTVRQVSATALQDLTYDGSSSDLAHSIGNPKGTAWETYTTDQNGYMTLGPGTRLLPVGTSTATFTLAVDNNQADNGEVLRLEAVDVTNNQLLATRLVRRQDFSAPMVAQDFDLSFELKQQAAIDLRVYSYGRSYIQHLRTKVRPDRLTLNSLWDGTAHFEPRVNSNLGNVSSLVALDGIEYAFERQAFTSPGCQDGIGLRTVVRMSKDQGITWSDPVLAMDAPGGNGADACMVTDGSAFYDAETDVWHAVYQCIGKPNSGGWKLCHYSKSGSSPMGAFTPDASNPVVKGGQLWSQICSGSGKACPTSMVDEGTAQIIGKTNGYYYVTFHGANFESGRNTGARGVARTSDFKNWEVSGADLPGNAMMAPTDCNAWNANWGPGGCIGEGDASLIRSGGYNYMLVEAADKSLNCTPGQKWVFGLVRSPILAPSGSWENYASNPLVMDPIDSPNGCSLQYMNFVRNRGDLFLSFGYHSSLGTFPDIFYQLVDGPGPARVSPPQ